MNIAGVKVFPTGHIFVKNELKNTTQTTQNRPNRLTSHIQLPVSFKCYTPSVTLYGRLKWLAAISPNLFSYTRIYTYVRPMAHA